MTILKKKSTGFYLIALALMSGVVACIRYTTWSAAMQNSVVLIALLAGIVLDIALIFYDNPLMVVASTACYSVALVQLLSDSVGSFVDAFQGIVMFGDSTQIGTITTISILLAVSVLASIIGSFMQRVKA